MRLVVLTILEFVPFVFILWTANGAEGRRAAGRTYLGWTVLTYVLLGILLLLGLVSGLLFQVAAQARRAILKMLLGLEAADRV